MTPKRILYIEANEDGTVGGSHQALLDLVRNLDKDRFEPIVLFYQDNVFAEKIRKLGIEVHDLQEMRALERSINQKGGRLAKVVGLARAIQRRRRFLREHRIDLVHINNSPRVGNDDWLPAAGMCGIPIIASAMGDAEPEPNILRAWLFRRFDCVVPVSDYIREAMQRKGVSPQRIHKVHHGVDVDGVRARIRRSREEVRQEFGVRSDEFLIAMVANVREWKGQHVVLSALAMLDSEVRERVKVLFAGAASENDKEYVARLNRMVSEASLERHVQFLGRRTDVPDLFNAADVAVHASIRPEPGGIAVLEAMATGTAVVAADKGGHVEYLLPDYGIVFDTRSPADLARIITNLHSDANLVNRLGSAAFERVRQFSIRRNVDETMAVYRKLLTVV